MHNVTSIKKYQVRLQIILLLLIFYIGNCKCIYAQNKFGIGVSYMHNFEIDPATTYDALAINVIYNINKIKLQAGPLICRAIPESKFKARAGANFRFQYQIVSLTNFTAHLNYSCLYINHSIDNFYENVTKHILHNNFGAGIDFNLKNQKTFLTLNAEYSFAYAWLDYYPAKGGYNTLFVDIGIHTLFF